ncbi:MAG TPA: amidohydrolase family protein [Phycisphaeraceae bacterium]
MSMKPDAPIRIYRVAAVRDAQGVRARPGAVAVRSGRVLAAGPEDDLPLRLRQQAQVIDLPTKLILPALVNAHTHLDLTDLGPTPYGGDWAGWLSDVIRRRRREPQAIAQAVQRGLRLSREAGVGYVGDIAGSAEAIQARQQAPPDVSLPGVIYLECVGITASTAAASAQHLGQTLDALPFEIPMPPCQRGVVLGIEPHAPYSASRALYESATRLSHQRLYRLTTHLAETPEEIAFVRDAAGPLADLLRRLGKWDEAIRPAHQHPIDWLEPVLRRGRWLVAHCNYVDDEHLGLLSRTGTSVAYCPIASEYFGHRGHRYRDMLRAGVNVCLGTDSILCQPASEPQPMGIWPQMRFLYRRDGTDPDVLLKMATINGMRALELAEADATLAPGSPARFTLLTIDPDDGTDPLVQALQNNAPATMLDATALPKDPMQEESA